MTEVTIDDYCKVAYALSIGTKISDLGRPGTAITHSIAQNMHLSEPTAKIGMKIDAHYRRQRCSPVTLVFCNISFMWIFAGVP